MSARSARQCEHTTLLLEEMRLKKSTSRKTCSQSTTWEEENSWEQGNIQQRAGEMGSWDRSFPGASQHKALIWKKGMQISKGMEQQGDE